MTLWCKKRSLPTQMDLYNPYMVPHTIPQGNYNFQMSTNKIKISMKFPHLEKLIYLMKDLKYEHQSIFPFWGRVKLIFGTGRKNQIFFSKNSS